MNDSTFGIPAEEVFAKIFGQKPCGVSLLISKEEADHRNPPPPPPSTFLYLVSAEKEGIKYWKVGITVCENPLDRDREHYKDVFRKEEFAWQRHAQDVETAIATHFRELTKLCIKKKLEVVKPPTREGIDIFFALQDVLEIFDFWVNLGRTSSQVPTPEWYKPKSYEPYFTFKSSHETEPCLNTPEFYYAYIHMFSAGWHKGSKLYEEYRQYDRVGTEECPFPGTGMFSKETRKGLAHYYRLTDWFEPYRKHLMSFRPQQPDVDDPMWW